MRKLNISDAQSGRLWGIVLAGGDGTRLQSLTRLISGAPIPKQYCRIDGRRSLLEATLERIAPVVPRWRTLVVVNAGHLHLARHQLDALPPSNVLIQPRNLDTGPGILVSLLEVARRDSEATVVIFPSDHDIRCEAAFRPHVFRMTDVIAAHPDRIALLGARPDRPDTAYGYVIPGRRIDSFADVFDVGAFHEKPGERVAAALVRRGALWNTFIMVGRVARLLALISDARREDVARLASLPADPIALAPVYERLAPWNFSRDFLTNVAAQLVVARADDLDWSDWGTPEAVERTFATLGLVPPWRTRAAEAIATVAS